MRNVERLCVLFNLSLNCFFLTEFFCHCVLEYNCILFDVMNFFSFKELKTSQHAMSNEYTMDDEIPERSKSTASTELYQLLAC